MELLAGWAACAIVILVGWYFCRRQDKLIDILISQNKQFFDEMKSFYFPASRNHTVSAPTDQPLYTQGRPIAADDQEGMTPSEEKEAILEMLKMSAKGYEKEIIDGETEYFKTDKK
jgi:hypothetical protein